MKPLISYVVTAYNIEEYIEESILSAFAQTYSPLEIVLSDDCSTDRTFMIMKKMTEQYNGNHRIILNRNEKNLGITKHMNRAYMILSHGDIILPAHGDDISFPKRTELSYNFLNRNQHVNIVAFCMKAIDYKSKFILSGEYDVIVKKPKIFSIQDSSIAKIPSTSCAFRREVWDFFGPISDQCPSEDEIFTFRGLLLGDTVLLPNVQVLYRKHDKSDSNISGFNNEKLFQIAYQRIRDVKFAYKKRIINIYEAKRLIKIIVKSTKQRILFRRLYKKKDLFSLFIILNSKLFSIRLKCAYIKLFIRWRYNRILYREKTY